MSTPDTSAPLPFRVTSDAFENLPAMNVGSTQGFIGDTFSNPDGSEMCCGYFELKHTDEPLLYVYEYDEMKVVLEGEFLLENRETGQSQVARAKDVIFFPKGSRIHFSTPDKALAFYTGHRSADLL
ncbi:MAG: hypothetical protein ABWY58_04295 [Aeromicrobium sp.]